MNEWPFWGPRSHNLILRGQQRSAWLYISYTKWDDPPIVYPFSSTTTWMSQEVSSWLVSGL